MPARDEDAQLWTFGLLQMGPASYDLTERLLRGAASPAESDKLNLTRTLLALQLAAVCEGGPPVARAMLDERAPALPQWAGNLPLKRLTARERASIREALDVEDWVTRQLKAAPPISPEQLERIAKIFATFVVQDDASAPT
jgi:hypothetical protein